MAEFQQRGEDLGNSFAECERMLEEAEGRLRHLEAGGSDGEDGEERDAELKKVRAAVEKLREDQKSFARLMAEYREEEKKLPWNVDTLSREGFSKARPRGSTRALGGGEGAGLHPSSFCSIPERAQRQDCR